MDNFKQIELLFAQLSSIPDSELSDEECAEFSEFVDFGEYGVALGTVEGIFVEERKCPTDVELDIIRKLAELMKKDPGPILERLRAISKI